MQPACRKDARGRKPRDPREVLNGTLWVLLWVLRTGAPWKDLPGRHPPRQTCRRRFQQWVKAGFFRRVLEVLAADLQERGGVDIREAFTDGSFAPAKKGAVPSAGQGAAKAAGSWQLRTPPALQALRLIEVRPAEAALDSLFLSGMPGKLAGGKAHDSGKPDQNLLKSMALS